MSSLSSPGNTQQLGGPCKKGTVRFRTFFAAESRPSHSFAPDAVFELVPRSLCLSLMITLAENTYHKSAGRSNMVLPSTFTPTLSEFEILVLVVGIHEYFPTAGALT